MPRAPLLGQAVGVLAGQRLDEPRLAVVDVAGGADGQRHALTPRAARRRRRPRRPRRRGACGSRAAAGRRARCRSTAASPSRSGAASASSTAHAKLGSSASGSAPPPTRPTVSSTAPPDERRQPLGPRAHRFGGSSSIRSTGISRARARGRGRGRASPRARRASACRRAARAAAGGAAAARRARRGRRRSRPAGRRAACRRRSRRGRRRRRGSPPRTARPARSTSAPEPRSSTSGRPCRRATAASSASRGCSVKPTTRKFDWCTRRSSGRLGPDRALVVGGARAVRRADLDEPRARAGEHVGDPEAVADLDQLAARDEHLAALGERGEREQHRGGVVVDDERRLRAGEPAQERGDVVLPRAARARVEVVLEVRVAARRSRRRARAPPRRAARGPRFVCTMTPVAFSTRRRLGARTAASSRAARAAEVAGIGARADLLARPLEERPRGVDRERVRRAGASELVHRREVAQLHAERLRRMRASVQQEPCEEAGAFLVRVASTWHASGRGRDRTCPSRCRIAEGARHCSPVSAGDGRRRAIVAIAGHPGAAASRHNVVVVEPAGSTGWPSSCSTSGLMCVVRIGEAASSRRTCRSEGARRAPEPCLGLGERSSCVPTLRRVDRDAAGADVGRLRGERRDVDSSTQRRVELRRLRGRSAQRALVRLDHGSAPWSRPPSDELSDVAADDVLGAAERRASAAPRSADVTSRSGEHRPTRDDRAAAAAAGRRCEERRPPTHRRKIGDRLDARRGQRPRVGHAARVVGVEHR